MRRLVFNLIILGTLSFPRGARSQIKGPLDWGQGGFAAQGTLATTCVQNFYHRGAQPLCVDFAREAGRTKFWIYLTGQSLCYGDAGDLDATLAELKQMLARARDWSEKAKSNNISTLETKELFQFARTLYPPNPVFGVPSRVLEPATFRIFTQGNERNTLLFFSGEGFDEPEWPALQFVVDHMKELIPKYEERAIPIERAEAAEKKKKDDLFKP
jgi:hypothetical protein